MKRHLTLFALVTLAFGCTEYEMVPDQDDPVNPQVDTGWADEEELRPVAVCSVTPNPVAPPFESASWLGDESYDPTGGILVEYRWSLTDKPAGSAVNMPSGEAVRRDFVPDLAGDYEGELIVVNNAGLVSKPCYTVLESVPAQDFWVEMYWGESHDDMDLHLLAPGGSLESNTDCYYSNCVDRGLDWGVHNDVADDPSLDIDDIPGTGPENINIQWPFGDNVKWQWMVKIGGLNLEDYVNYTLGQYKDAYLESTLVKLMYQVPPFDVFKPVYVSEHGFVVVYKVNYPQ